MEILDSLHEIETTKYLWKPMRKFQNFTFVALLILLLFIYFNIFRLGSLILCFVILISVPVAYQMTKFTTFATIWDNLDYTGLIKRDLIFTTSDNNRIRGYIYYRADLNPLEQKEEPIKKYPAVIGLHGYGSHHKVMDRYCLPSLLKLGFVYFTYDARGHGINKKGFVPYDPAAFQELADFISEIKQLAFVDPGRIGVVAMSYGASKASVIAYPDPDVKLLIFLSGIFDILLNKEKASIIEHIKLYLTGFRWTKDLSYFKALSGIYRFKKEGIILRGNTEPTSNNERVFIFSNQDDPQANIQNTYAAIEKLGLKPSNYRIFPKGGHHFKGNEYYLSVEIFDVLQKYL
jgi:hypothetical protein